jgi:prepilin-type N-terminal cleavage/methylation domain-containing protein
MICGRKDPMNKTRPTILAIGNRSPHAGFSLIEMLLVIGLIAIASALVVSSARGILSGFGSKPLPQILRETIREARYQAVSSKQPVQLLFDAKAGQLVIAAASGARLYAVDTGYGPDSPQLDIRFHQVLPARGTDPTARRTLYEIDGAWFRPDRSSTPLQVELQIDRVRSSHRFDPFSDFELSPL